MGYSPLVKAKIVKYDSTNSHHHNNNSTHSFSFAREVWVVMPLLLLSSLGAAFLFTQFQDTVSPLTIPSLKNAASHVAHVSQGAFMRPDVKEVDGIIYNYYDVTEGEVKKNEYLSVILDRYGVSAAEIDRIATAEKAMEQRPLLRTGKPYTVLVNKETAKAEYFIYEPNAYEYYTYKLGETPEITLKKRKVNRKKAQASGVITSSLWNAIVDNEAISPNMVDAMAANMEEAFQWSVDFHHLQKGDRFKLIYEEDWVQGKRVGTGKLLAAVFDFDGQSYHAIRYKSDNYDGFFDLEGRPMAKTFLKAPVKYSRISSRYNPRRYHPVLKRRKPHLGTDFAAPRGTPIYSTANGTVIKKSRTRGNGNYVKVKHSDTYTTQYLHMSGFAKGLKVGQRVKQGQVIGYVGSTGLATGPHVCYRFWKNGKQVDPLRLNFAPPEPMDEKDRNLFLVEKDHWLEELNAIPYQAAETTAANP